MNKQIFSLALVASLTACGGGSSSSSNDDTTDPVDPAPQPETSYCEAVDNTITLAEGASCQLSPEQLDNHSISVGTDEVSCSNGRISVGGNSFNGSFDFNGLQIQCEAQEETVDRSAYRVTNSTEFAKVDELSDGFVNFDSLTVEGNAEAITEENVTYAQVHGNLEQGRFSISLAPKDINFIPAGSDSVIGVVFTTPDVSSETLINDGFTTDLFISSIDEITGDINFSCTYGGTLANLNCAGQAIDLSDRFTSVPAKTVLHFVGCDESRICKTAISIPVQFN
jgi:hypothetical protein